MRPNSAARSFRAMGQFRHAFGQMWITKPGELISSANRAQMGPEMLMGESHLDVAAQLKLLADADRPALLALWIDCFGAPPAFRASRDLLALILAYHLQEKTEGGLSQASRRRLRALAEKLNKGKSSAPSRPSLRAGTRLIREWRGQ